jgi:hypothetical protein
VKEIFAQFKVIVNNLEGEIEQRVREKYLLTQKPTGEPAAAEVSKISVWMMSD